MDPLDQENALLEQRIAQLEASLGSQQPQSEAAQPSGYGLGQLAFDVPVGITRGVAGLADVLSYPFVKGLEYAGAPVETFGATKALDALILGSPALKGPGAAEILGVRPQTEVQRAVEFMTPGPGGKGKLASELGLGLTSYLGTRAGETIAPESAYSGLVGALLAPTAAQSAISGTRKLASALSPTANIVLGNEDALRTAANANVLAALGEEGAQRLAIAQQIPELGIGAGGVPLTAAEIAQTPSAAKYQQSFLNTPEGGNILQPALDARKSELTAALERFGITPQQGEMSLMMRDAAETAATQKALQDNAIASALGTTATGEGLTKGEKSKLLQSNLLERENEAYSPVSEIWEQVNKKAKMDIVPQLIDTINEFKQFGPLTKKRISSVAKDAISTARDIVYKKDGLITVGQYQDLRATANAALRNADKTTDAAEISLMRKLKNGLDSIDESAIISRGGEEELGNLIDAIKATKQFKQTYAQGVVGEILGKRGGELKVKASQAIDRALKAPENITEIFGKFGKESDEAIVIRDELLARLTQAKNPTEYLGKNKDLFKSAFESDYANVVNFAQKRGQGAPLEEFSKITDSTIPNKIFGNERSAEKFARQFADSPVLQMGRAKFISDKLMKKGGPLENLTNNKAIAKKLFKDDLPELEKVLKDLEVSKSPAALEKQAASGNSITSIRQTALGALTGARGVINAMRKGTLAGTLAGSGTMTGALVGYSVGNWVKQIGEARNSAMNAFEAELLANPKLINLASAPPTKANIDALMQFGVQLGYFSGKSQTENVVDTPEVAASMAATAPQEDFESENMLLEQRILELEKTLNPASQVKVGKQNVSLPQGDKYAPTSLVKAVIQVESAGNKDAVSSKGARGLMQLMPGTAKDLGVDATDPEQNVEGGSRYLRQQLDTFGDERLALAAYNWGPANIKSAIAKVKAEGKTPTWDNIKQFVKIPKETREYVEKVLRLV